MADAPSRCPTCGTDVPEGAARCPGCGRVFGEENRCPHCNAIAAVIERGGKTICAACGKPRVGATTLDGGRPRGSRVPASSAGRKAGTDAMVARASGRAQRAFGGFSLAMGIIAAGLLAALVPGAAGIALAIVAALVGVGTGVFAIRRGARAMERARGIGAQVDRTALRELAAKRGGVLTAAQVAEALAVPVDDADAMLTALVGDGSEVDVEIDDVGGVAYVFHDLRARGPQVRVDEAPADEELGVEVPDERARRERERER